MVNLRRDARRGDRKLPRNYFSRREQWRLLLLVMGLGLIVLLMLEVRNPDNWGLFYWLTQAETSEKPSGKESDHSYYDYDTTFRPPPVQEEPAGTVRIVKRPDEADRRPGRKYFPGVEPSFLASVEDNTPLRSQDGAAWYQLLNVLQSNSSDFLRRSSTGEVDFVQLYEQPESYRGELVGIRGTVRRATHFDAGKNRYGIEGYTQLIIQPDRGALRPFVVYVLNVPEDFPQGERLHEEVELTGFFFKNWVYRARHSTEIAPLLLARDIVWQPVVAEPVSMPSGLAIFAVVGGTGLVGVLLAWIVYAVNRRIVSARTRAAVLPDPGDELTAIESEPVTPFDLDAALSRHRSEPEGPC